MGCEISEIKIEIEKLKHHLEVASKAIEILASEITKLHFEQSLLKEKIIKIYEYDKTLWN